MWYLFSLLGHWGRYGSVVVIRYSNVLEILACFLSFNRATITANSQFPKKSEECPHQTKIKKRIYDLIKLNAHGLFIYIYLKRKRLWVFSHPSMAPLPEPSKLGVLLSIFAPLSTALFWAEKSKVLPEISSLGVTAPIPTVTFTLRNFLQFFSESWDSIFSCSFRCCHCLVLPIDCICELDWATPPPCLPNRTYPPAQKN